MKIELTIKTSYMPNWGMWEGIRELVQNGRDAETEQNATLTVRHRKDTDTLVIENEGATLPHEALLLGHTSKTDRSDLIGKFGEGLKLGVLALVRAGHKIKIRSGSEVWVPTIQRSEKFNADVLVFDIQKGRKEENRVAVEVSGLSAEDWDRLKLLFLFLGDVQDNECVRTPQGSLLLGERFKGRVYVKGIFVANYSQFTYGYDFADADVDRDRRMISSFDLNYRTQLVWRETVARRPDLVTHFGTMLETEAPDVGGVDEFTAAAVPQPVRQTLAARFQERHGAEALPVGSLSDSAEVGHLGRTGIVTPRGLRAVLEQEMGNIEANKTKLRNETIHMYGWADLTSMEQANLTYGIDLINPVEPLTLDQVEVVDFRDPKIQGMFKDSKVLLAKKILSDRPLTLTTQIHEVAHRVGGDGSKSHVANIERIWAGVATRMMDTIDRLQAPTAIERLASEE